MIFPPNPPVASTLLPSWEIRSMDITKGIVPHHEGEGGIPPPPPKKMNKMGVNPFKNFQSTSSFTNLKIRGEWGVGGGAEFQIVASMASTLEEPSSSLVNKLPIFIASIHLASNYLRNPVTQFETLFS